MQILKEIILKNQIITVRQFIVDNTEDLRLKVHKADKIIVAK